jgi:hypothetical protein
MQNTKCLVGPVALTSTYTTNIFNPPTTTGGTNPGTPSSNTFAIIYWIQLIDKGGNGGTVNLYLGASTANSAGTELCKALAVPANGITPIYFPSGLRITTSQYIVGGASAGTEITFLAGGEIGIGT